MIRFFLLLSTLLLMVCPASAEHNALKILHLTFHQGCAKEFEAVANIFGHDVTTWWIPGLAPRSFDGTSQGNVLYNISHDRAERIWNLHKKAFQQFDVVITSDTAPLARIFLQNGFTKPLIIWICNRFDYSDQASLDSDFPDAEYYQLIDQAKLQEKVTIVAYTAFEHEYAKSKGVDTGSLVITPCAPQTIPSSAPSLIPTSVAKEETFFLPPYWNETSYMNLSDHCHALGIFCFCGRYNGPADLKEFKGIIHLPYAWSNFALFENIASGVPYFLPSPKFLQTLVREATYWHMNSSYLIQKKFWLSEWYKPDRKEIFIYFDSWSDLQHKIQTTDYTALKNKIKTYAKEHQTLMLERWAQIFQRLE